MFDPSLPADFQGYRDPGNDDATEIDEIYDSMLLNRKLMNNSMLFFPGNTTQDEDESVE